MEKHTMLALSTAHVTLETSNLMDNKNIKSVILYDKDNVGWFVYVPESCDFDALDDCPEELRKCLTFARDNDFNWIMFDCDVDTIDELPSYEW